MIINSMDRLGYYLVGDKKFHSKILALLEQKKTKEKLRWIFNNDIFDSINWKIPIDTPLSDLYKKRALQLRNKLSAAYRNVDRLGSAQDVQQIGVGITHRF